jgi:hypothetical protein
MPYLENLRDHEADRHRIGSQPTTGQHRAFCPAARDRPGQPTPGEPDRDGAELSGAVDGLHAAVQEAFAELDKAEGHRALQYRALLRIFHALAAHTTAEQELLAPVLDGQPGRHERTVERQLARHRLLEVLLVELAAMVPAEQPFEAKVRLLRELFGEHVAEQVQALAPALHHLDPGERRRLTEEVSARARRLREAS